MLDKITLMLLLPFYGLWKMLLNKKFSKKPFQMFLLSSTFLNSIILWTILYNETTNFWLKLICAVFFLLTITFFLSKTVKNVVYEGSKRQWEDDKMQEYFRGLVFYL